MKNKTANKTQNQLQQSQRWHKNHMKTFLNQVKSKEIHKTRFFYERKCKKKRDIERFNIKTRHSTEKRDTER